MDQIALPMAELAAQMGFGWPLMEGRAIGDRRLAPAVPPSPAALRLALGEQLRQAGAPPTGAVDMTIDGLRACECFGGSRRAHDGVSWPS